MARVEPLRGSAVSHSKDVLQDQLRWLELKQEETKGDLLSANRQMVRIQTEVNNLEEEMGKRDETMKDIRIGIETLEKYGA